jgi:hypothetical protein
VGDDSIGLGATAAQCGDGRAERRHLSEGTFYGDLAAEHVERVEPDDLVRTRDPVNHDGFAVTRARDADVADGHGSGRLDDDVVPVAAGRALPDLRKVALAVIANDRDGAVDARAVAVSSLNWVGAVTVTEEAPPSPSWRCGSVPHTPTWSALMRTSPGCASGVASSLTG